MQSVTKKQRYGAWPTVAAIIIVTPVLFAATISLFDAVVESWPNYAAEIANYLTTDPSWIFEAAAVAVGGFYLYYRSVRHRMLKVRCADMLLVELGNIRTDVDLAKCNYAPGSRPYQDLPRAMYDGLITSNNVSHFDVDIQQKLHSLYTHIHRYNVIAEESRQIHLADTATHARGHPDQQLAQSNLEKLIKKWKDASDSVEEFRYKHEPWGSARKIAITFNLLEKD